MGHLLERGAYIGINMVMGKQSIVMGWYCYLVEKKKKKGKKKHLM